MSRLPKTEKVLKNPPKLSFLWTAIASMFLRLRTLKRKSDAVLLDADCELTSGETIENKSFKRISCVNRAVPLTYESLKRSILNDLRRYGREALAYDIEVGKLTTEELKGVLYEVTSEEINLVFLWSSFCQKVEVLEELLRLGASTKYSDSIHGLTALHISCFVGCSEITNYLLKHNFNINLIDKWYSPLHCATLASKVGIVNILLDHGARVNSMTNGPGYETPLYIAVKVNALDCVKVLMERGAQVYQEGKLGDLSPLFLAAELGRADCLKAILESKVDCNEFKKNENGNTALHIAAEEGHADCIDVLLKHGANPNLTNLRGQSALHLAVKANSYTSVVSLIRSGNADPNVADQTKRTPLHVAVELIADSRKDIIKVLICNGADVNAQDQDGFTPLHLAALNELTLCVSILISNNADCSIKTKSGITAISLIAKKTPGAIHTIKEKLTENISLIYHQESLNDVEMSFDFKTGLHHPKEYDILNAFIDAGQKELLLHPYLMAFLYVTWRRIRKCYYGMIYNSLIFSLFLLFYVLTSLAYDCDRQIKEAPASNSSVYCNNNSNLNKFLLNSPFTLKTQWYVLLYFTITLAYRKIYGFQGYPSLRHYCINWGNVLEWHGIVYAFVVSFIYTGHVETWQVHAGAFGIMAAWTNVMYMIGQLPVFGPYVEMFQKVQNEFKKLLLVFFPFLVGYTIAFCIIFPNSSAFYTPFIGFTTTLVMMTGDMNYNLLLDYSREENPTDLAKFTAQLAYTLFLLFVTIILMNLLVGIAVHDIQGLQKNADLTRLVRQAKMCSYIEMSHYKRSAYSKLIMTVLRVTPKEYVPVFTVKPLEAEQTVNLKEIIQAAYDLAKKRETEKKKLLTRVSSEGGAWRKVLGGSLKRDNVSSTKFTQGLSKVMQKLEEQSKELKNLSREVTELKEMIESGVPMTPVEDKEICFYINDEIIKIDK
ncbi:transient receptor potential channel pyrexia-like [Anthonomus grandis grandis]|uniref:transient receptor potential channel pyrexia-like n=1 Tax=Anthonomus grandis grandis TaxID=2921223 RepID=UPI002165D30C|nr:transient receptor potential channel pyrexia-like [Anthonomus grandis grandis]